MSFLLLGSKNKEECRKHQHEGQEVERHRNLGLERHFVNVLLLEKLDEVFAVHNRHLVVESTPGKGQFLVLLKERGDGVPGGIGEDVVEAIPVTCDADHITCTGGI